MSAQTIGSAAPSNILGRSGIFAKLRHSDPKSRLYIMPLLRPAQVGTASVDLRLGTDFVLFQRTKFMGLDPLGTDESLSLAERLREFKESIGSYQTRLRVPYGKSMTLHPGQFALGGTLEYVRFPWDLAGYVIGRSSWGRLGLVVATAVMVHPGFSGIITLELANLGDAPIALYPGTRIAQLALHPAEEVPPANRPKSKYACLVEPSLPRLEADDDWDVVERLKRVHAQDGPAI